MKTKKKIITVVGPTASGKTDVAIALAKKLKGELISADSMQIYQEMQIGTAKPTREELGDIPCHLIDFVAPDQRFSAASFKQQATDLIRDILERGKEPILVGGTGLYINAMTLPWILDDIPVNQEGRRKFYAEIELVDNDTLYRRLEKIDPVAAAGVHPNNRKRVMRALEIFETTGRTKTQLDEEAAKQTLAYDYFMIGLQFPREILYRRIDERVDLMVTAGLPEEVAELRRKGYHQDLLSMQAIGYKEFFPYLEGEETLEECVRILKRDTRHFAKRQLTWFRKDDRIHWFEPLQYDRQEMMIDAMIDLFTKSDCS